MLLISSCFDDLFYEQEHFHCDQHERQHLRCWVMADFIMILSKLWVVLSLYGAIAATAVHYCIFMPLKYTYSWVTHFFLYEARF